MNTDPHKIKRPNEKSPFGRNAVKRTPKKSFFTKGALVNAFTIVAISAATVLYSTNTINHDITPERSVIETANLQQKEQDRFILKSAKKTTPPFNSRGSGGRGGASSGIDTGQQAFSTENERGSGGRGGGSATGSCNSCNTTPQTHEERTSDSRNSLFHHAFIKKIADGVAVVSTDRHIDSRDLLISDPENKISETWRGVVMPKQDDGSSHPDLDVKKIAKIKSQKVGGKVIGQYQNVKDHTSNYKTKTRKL